MILGHFYAILAYFIVFLPYFHSFSSILALFYEKTAIKRCRKTPENGTFLSLFYKNFTAYFQEIIWNGAHIFNYFNKAWAKCSSFSGFRAQCSASGRRPSSLGAFGPGAPEGSLAKLARRVRCGAGPKAQDLVCKSHIYKYISNRISKQHL